MLLSPPVPRACGILSVFENILVCCEALSLCFAIILKTAIGLLRYGNTPAFRGTGLMHIRCPWQGAISVRGWFPVHAKLWGIGQVIDASKLWGASGKHNKVLAIRSPPRLI